MRHLVNAARHIVGQRTCWACSTCCGSVIPRRVRTGANVYIDSEVPLNKGVSSSAAVEVAVMKPAAAAYGIALAWH